MASIVRHASPFAETEQPPPPVVLLILQTDVEHISTGPGLLMHEDLESAKKRVAFAPSPEHTYPPPPILTKKIKKPDQVTRKIVENHHGWQSSESDTEEIKKTVHGLVQSLLDTNKPVTDQKDEDLDKVYRQAALAHPVLHKYDDNWATYCIVQAHLKSTAATAAKLKRALREVVASAADHTDRRTRSTKQFIAMDVDPDIPNDNGDRRGNRGQIQRSSSAKVRAVNGPDREEYENALGDAALYRDQAVNAKQKAQQLRAQLEAAEKMRADQVASLNKAIAEMQEHEGQMEAQFLGDQEKLQEIISPLQHDEVNRLNRLLVQKKDEAIQLRAYSSLQSKKTPQNKPPPRRGTRSSLDPARNSSTRTIHIPLDPIQVTTAPSGTPNPKQKAKLAATPAFADLLGTDVDTLSGLIGKLERFLISDDVTLAQFSLRRAIYDKFGVEQASDFHIYNPAEEAKVAACEEGLADPPDDLFQWDFGSGYTVVDAALEVDGEDGDIAKAGVDRDLLEALIAEKLVRYHGAWKGFQPRFEESQGRMETVREARARGAQYFEQQQLASRSTSSKHRKFENRVQTITVTIEIKKDEGIAGDIETWERLLEMVEHLGEQGMSSEEEDEIEVDNTKVLVYKVKLCIWREPRVVEYLRFVDAQTALFKKNHRLGPPPASRIRSGVPGSSKAPCGLPESLYNGEWLKKATPTYLKELKVSKEAFGLFVAGDRKDGALNWMEYVKLSNTRDTRVANE
ncbi:hypothetical protein B0H11DRAFT_2243966 [Mycena galericulata]|nr:hypothetical protein B0H11DRAFT_2243966 [Mycena galericulata]